MDKKPWFGERLNNSLEVIQLVSARAGIWSRASASTTMSHICPTPSTRSQRPSCLSLWLYRLGFIILSLFHTRKLKLREIKRILQGHLINGSGRNQNEQGRQNWFLLFCRKVGHPFATSVYGEYIWLALCVVSSFFHCSKPPCLISEKHVARGAHPSKPLT